MASIANIVHIHLQLTNNPPADMIVNGSVFGLNIKKTNQ